MKMLSILGSIFSTYEYFVGNFHSWLVLDTEQLRSKKRHQCLKAELCHAYVLGLWSLEEGQSRTLGLRGRLGFMLLQMGPRGAAMLSREPLMLLHTTGQQGNAEDGDEP